MTEAAFLAQVIALARLAGWRVAHFRAARTAGGWRTPCQADAAGWPDLFLVRGTRAVALELKADRGRLREEQRRWLDCLRAAGVEAHCFRPQDWPEIVGVLGR